MYRKKNLKMEHGWSRKMGEKSISKFCEGHGKLMSDCWKFPQEMSIPRRETKITLLSLFSSWSNLRARLSNFSLRIKMFFCTYRSRTIHQLQKASSTLLPVTKRFSFLSPTEPYALLTRQLANSQFFLLAVQHLFTFHLFPATVVFEERRTKKRGELKIFFVNGFVRKTITIFFPIFIVDSHVWSTEFNDRNSRTNYFQNES